MSRNPSDWFRTFLLHCDQNGLWRKVAPYVGSHYLPPLDSSENSCRSPRTNRASRSIPHHLRQNTLPFSLLVPVIRNVYDPIAATLTFPKPKIIDADVRNSGSPHKMLSSGRNEVDYHFGTPVPEKALGVGRFFSTEFGILESASNRSNRTRFSSYQNLR